MKKTGDPKNILVYRIGHLGDAICTIPAIFAIRKRFPDSRISLLANLETGRNYDPASVLKNTGCIDQIIQYEIPRIRHPEHLRKLIAELSQLRPDLFIYLFPSHAPIVRVVRDYVFFKIILRCRMVGFDIGYLLKILFAKIAKRGHFLKEVNRLMKLLKPLGIPPLDVEFKLPITGEDKAAVDALWTKSGLEGGPVVVLAPAGKYVTTQWPMENYFNLCDRLQQEFGVKVVMLGGPDEAAKIKPYEKNVPSGLILLIGKTSVMESAEIIKRAKLLIGNDGSVIHLAAAVNTPAIGLYSSKDFPERWHPYGDRHKVLRNDSLPCRYCFNERCEKNLCLQSITVEQVMAACRKYLSA